jgi:hypothetical protein
VRERERERERAFFSDRYNYSEKETKTLEAKR